MVLDLKITISIMEQLLQETPLEIIRIQFGEMVYMLILSYQFQDPSMMDNGYLRWTILRTQHHWSIHGKGFQIM